jgi:hypothetical protein
MRKTELCGAASFRYIAAMYCSRKHRRSLQCGKNEMISQTSQVQVKLSDLESRSLSCQHEQYKTHFMGGTVYRSPVVLARQASRARASDGI